MQLCSMVELSPAAVASGTSDTPNTTTPRTMQPPHNHKQREQQRTPHYSYISSTYYSHFLPTPTSPLLSSPPTLLHLYLHLSFFLPIPPPPSTEMSRFYFALALLVALFSFSCAETVVLDSVGNGVLLPTTGGNATSYITVLGSGASTSPYHLYVSLNNGKGPNDPISSAEVESFFFNTPGVGAVNSSAVLFGNASLITELFSSSFTKDSGVAGNYLSNASLPNTATGTYTFVFDIPVLSTLTVNLTYVQSGSAPLPITEFVQITIFNPVGVVGDPQFVGLRGQSYQVHGIDGAVYNIVSEKNTQVNSRFVFLTEGECPIINGKKDLNCWSHPGSYLGEISFQAVVDGKLHAALVQAGSSTAGFSGVQVDGKALKVGDKVTFGDFSVSVISAFTVVVLTESFEFELSNSDMFINQALRLRVPISQLQSHGLIGQTHSTKTYATAIKYIDGEVDDYVIQDNDIFGSDFVFNRFQL